MLNIKFIIIYLVNFYMIFKLSVLFINVCLDTNELIITTKCYSTLVLTLELTLVLTLEFSVFLNF